MRACVHLRGVWDGWGVYARARVCTIVRCMREAMSPTLCVSCGFEILSALVKYECIKNEVRVRASCMYRENIPSFNNQFLRMIQGVYESLSLYGSKFTLSRNK